MTQAVFCALVVEYGSNLANNYRRWQALAPLSTSLLHNISYIVNGVYLLLLLLLQSAL